MRKPTVKVVADGSNGYIVRYSPLTGPPVDVCEFDFAALDEMPPDFRKIGVAAVRARADAFASGVATGMRLAADALAEVLSP